MVVLRSDLGMSTGKMIAQACHASLKAYEKSEKRSVKLWKDQGMKKVVLKVSSEEELIKVFQDAKDAGLPAGNIKDAGRTELRPGTATCVGIGPAESDELNIITGSLDTL